MGVVAAEVESEAIAFDEGVLGAWNGGGGGAVGAFGGPVGGATERGEFLLRGKPVEVLGGSGKHDGERGDGESVRAMRFVPHESPVELSPDPDVPVEAFRQMLPRPEDEVDAPSVETEAAWTALLKDWTAAFPRTPARMVTAREDLDGVWVYARGEWYAVGPMKAGTSVALTPEMRMLASSSPEFEKGETQSLFQIAPFLVDLSGIVPVAEAELARRAGAEPSSSAESLVPDGAFLERLGEAFVVAVRHGAGGRTWLRPVAEEGGKPFDESGRIVWMELFP